MMILEQRTCDLLPTKFRTWYQSQRGSSNTNNSCITIIQESKPASHINERKNAARRRDANWRRKIRDGGFNREKGCFQVLLKHQQGTKTRTKLCSWDDYKFRRWWLGRNLPKASPIWSRWSWLHKFLQLCRRGLKEPAPTDPVKKHRRHQFFKGRRHQGQGIYLPWSHRFEEKRNKASRNKKIEEETQRLID